jgi:hypothetical protein
MILAAALALALQATPAPSPSAAPAPAPAPAAAPEASAMSQLTPAQQAAVQQAIVKLSQNPVGNITAIPFQNNFNYGLGPYTRFQYNLNIQPVIPIMLTPQWNLIARTIIPVLVQPSSASPVVCATSGCGSTFGIGDIQEQLFFAPKTAPGQLVWGIGPQFLVPSATPGTLGGGKWGAGPAAVALVMPGHFVMGMLFTQLWSFAGQANRPQISNALFQPFVNYNLAGGWSLSTSPNIVANWTATQSKWAVPLGGGIAKTFKAGDQPMQLSLSFYTYVARPISSPQTNLKFTWSLLFPVKRGINIADLIKEGQ